MKMLYIVSNIRDYMEYYGLYGKSWIISKNYDYFDFFQNSFPWCGNDSQTPWEYFAPY